jgi:hypothetical protein
MAVMELSRAPNLPDLVLLKRRLVEGFRAASIRRVEGKSPSGPCAAISAILSACAPNVSAIWDLIASRAICCVVPSLFSRLVEPT